MIGGALILKGQGSGRTLKGQGSGRTLKGRSGRDMRAVRRSGGYRNGRSRDLSRSVSCHALSGRCLSSAGHVGEAKLRRPRAR